MTGNKVVPCSWQEPTSGGPMLVASDIAAMAIGNAVVFVGSLTSRG
jgi:hypothetical protein